MAERGDGDKAREEFFSEAQEIVDGLSRDLLQLDALVKRGETDPELVNDVFRAVHTMKGLSGLFGAADIGEIVIVILGIAQSVQNQD